MSFWIKPLTAMPIPRCALLFVLVPVGAFAVGPRVAVPRATPLPLRTAPPRASSKILPVANVGLGGAACGSGLGLVGRSTPTAATAVPPATPAFVVIVVDPIQHLRD